MSTRTCKAALLTLALAGCATSLPAPDRATLRVEGTRVSIVAPAGYCIDQPTLDVGRGGGFLLMTDCAVLGEAAPDSPPAPALITVSVSGADMPSDIKTLDAFLSGPGAFLLGRSGDPKAVRVIDRRERDGVLLLKVEDTGPQPIPGVAPRFWRGFFSAGPRMAVAAVSGFAEADLSDAEALDLMAELIARTRAANAAPVDAPAPEG